MTFDFYKVSTEISKNKNDTMEITKYNKNIKNNENNENNKNYENISIERVKSMENFMKYQWSWTL